MYKANAKTQKTDNPFDDRVGLIYVRVSSKKQELEGHGRESQELRCKKELEQLGVPFVRSFADTYTGGGDFMNRPAMRELLAFVKAHPHKKFVVVFDDLKRFARDTAFHLKLRSMFKALDIIPRCLNYNFDDSPEGMFVESVLAAGNELERHQNARQVIQKQRARLEAGYWPFNSKKGYYFTVDETQGRIALPDDQGKILAVALEDFASGKLRRKIDVANYLVEKGYFSNKQAPFRYLERINKILKDPFHCGDIEYPQWGVTRRKGRHQGIISRETFELVQKRFYRDEARTKPRETISEKYPLRGLVLCAGCKRPLTAGTSRGRNGVLHVFYHCFNENCERRNKSIRKKDIEDRYDEALKDNHLKPESQKVVGAVFERVWREEIKYLEEEERAIEQKRRETKERIANLSNLALKASSDTVRLAYEGQIEQAAKELEELAPVEEDFDLDVPFRTALGKAVGLLEKPYETWHNLSILEQHRLFFFIFEKKLEYDKESGFQSASELCATRLFENLLLEPAMSVQRPGETLNRVKSYLSRFWEYYQGSIALQKALEMAT